MFVYVFVVLNGGFDDDIIHHPVRGTLFEKTERDTTICRIICGAETGLLLPVAMTTIVNAPATSYPCLDHRRESDQRENLSNGILLPAP